MPLEDHYSGDPAWKNFVACHRNELTDAVPSPDLVAALAGHEDIAIVIASVVGDAPAWIRRPVPALGGLTAIECVATREKVNRLRECLMRFPV
jgi:hypothetical protein